MSLFQNAIDATETILIIGFSSLNDPSEKDAGNRCASLFRPVEKDGSFDSAGSRFLTLPYSLDVGAYQNAS